MFGRTPFLHSTPGQIDLFERTAFLFRRRAALSFIDTVCLDAEVALTTALAALEDADLSLDSALALATALEGATAGDTTAASARALAMAAASAPCADVALSADTAAVEEALDGMRTTPTALEGEATDEALDASRALTETLEGSITLQRGAC